jgi:superkiller protein 3
MARATALEPFDVSAWTAAADLFRVTGRLGDALRSADKALALRPRLPEALLCKAKVVAQLGDVAASEQLLKTAIAVNRKWADSVIAYSDALSAWGRRAEAVRCVRDFLEVRPNAHEGWMQLSVLLDIPGEEHEAVAAAHKACQLAPGGEVLPWLRLAETRFKAGMEDEALSTLRSIEKRFAGRRDVTSKWAELLHRAGNTRAAADVLRTAADARPGDIEDLLEMAVLLRASDRAAAVAAAEEALARRPHSLRARRTLLSAAANGSELESRMFSELCELAPHEVLDMIRRAGAIGWRLESRDDAHRLLASAQRRRPGSPEVLRLWARVLEDEGCVAEAEGKLRAAVEANPHDLEITTQLAEVLGRQGKLGQAAEAFKSALEFRPRCRRLHLRLAKAEHAAGCTKAEETLALATEIAGRTDPALQIELARICADCRDNAAARDAVLTAKANARRSAPILRAAVGILKSTGNLQEAVECAEDLVKLEPTDVKHREGLRILQQELAWSRIPAGVPECEPASITLEEKP